MTVLNLNLSQLFINKPKTKNVGKNITPDDLSPSSMDLNYNLIKFRISKYYTH